MGLLCNVYYRTGGTARWTWKRLVGVFFKDDACTQMYDLKRMGYTSVAAPVGSPLPIEYDPNKYQNAIIIEDVKI